MKKALLVTLALLITTRASAQEASGVPLVRERDIVLDVAEQRELRQWTDDVGRYHQWYEQNRNRIAHNVFGFTSDRRELPPVPAWLDGKCDLLGYFDPRPVGELSAGCDLLSYYRSDFTQDPAAVQAALSQKQNEQDPHASFWKHVHLDAGWTSLDYRMHTYGVVGVHVTLPELAKRVQIFLPPGFLLLAVPDGRGGTTLQPGATIGVSVKMFAFEFPQGKNGTAYFNLAKAYLISGQSSIGGNAAVDLLGLSFAWGR
ncbi:MAG TPA: hypothetical protein VLI90_16430 [Tepidisphaeraceae bacterium]|nr:hypothetical protein [Tepidisphaeraceae bacterium]